MFAKSSLEKRLWQRVASVMNNLRLAGLRAAHRPHIPGDALMQALQDELTRQECLFSQRAIGQSHGWTEAANWRAGAMSAIEPKKSHASALIGRAA